MQRTFCPGAVGWPFSLSSTHNIPLLVSLQGSRLGSATWGSQDHVKGNMFLMLPLKKQGKAGRAGVGEVCSSQTEEIPEDSQRLLGEFPLDAAI